MQKPVTYPLMLVRLGVLLLLWSISGTTALAQNFIQDTIQAFNNSDIIFKRSGSNAPFLPVAYLGANSYGDAQIRSELSEQTLDFRQQSSSAAGGMPFLLSQRDALITGAYLSSSRFQSDNALVGDFRVDTVGLPLGWFRQVNPEWQAAAFVMPMAHRSTQRTSDWTLQTMAGFFTRYTRNEKLWWAFGLFADESPNSSFVLPYVGASWVINERWTLNAIMPWPAINYAPREDWLFSLGATPSGAAWSLQPAENEVAISLDAWDFGLTAERRVYNNLWLAARTGVGGLRGLRFNTDENSFEDADIGVGSSAFFSLSLKFRPTTPP